MCRALFFVMFLAAFVEAHSQETIVGKVHKVCEENTKQFSEFISCILLIRNSPESKDAVSGDGDFMLFSDKAMAYGEQVSRGTSTEGDARYQLRLMSIESEARRSQYSTAADECKRRRDGWQMAYNLRLMELGSRPGATMLSGIAQAQRDITMMYGPIPRCQ